MPLPATITGPITSLCPVGARAAKCTLLKCHEGMNNRLHQIEELLMQSDIVHFSPSWLIFQPIKVQSQDQKHQNNVRQTPFRVKPLCSRFHPLERKRIMTHCSRAKRASVICAAALNATCAAEQTQTVTRQSSTITVAPIQGKEKSPELDDGGTGFPPRDDGDGGGGGGGGGGHWSGGFFFFGFLALLGLLKDKESEGPYGSDRRR